MFRLEESYYRIFYPAIFSILPFLKFTDFKDFSFNNSINYKLMYIFLIILIYIFRIYINLLFRKLFVCDYLSITTYLKDEIRQFEQCTEKFSDFYDNPEKIYNGSVELLTLSKVIILI
jgi:hypothetical protein